MFRSVIRISIPLFIAVLLLTVVFSVTHVRAADAPIASNRQSVRAESLSPASLPITPSWSGQARKPESHFGWTTNPAGDVNGDGFDDVLVGAPDFDTNPGVLTDTGAAYLYCGGAITTGLPITVMDGITIGYPSWWVYGDQTAGHLGRYVTGIGDVNKDGYDDIAISAPDYEIGSEVDEGEVFVWHGSSDFCNRGQQLIDTADWLADSNQSYAHLARTVGGDVNGDGYNDLIAGSYLYDKWDYNLSQRITDTGAVFIWLGSAAGLHGGFNGDPDTAHWKAYGSQAYDKLGYSVAAVNVNGDPYADILASSIHYSNGQSEEGAVFAWYGGAMPYPVDASLDSANWKIEGNQATAHLGMSIASAGDVTGEGYDDVIISAPYYDYAPSDEGLVFVYYGSVNGLPGMTITPPANGQDAFNTANWKVRTNQANTYLGFTVGPAGDVNTDGYDDVIIGDHAYNSDNGMAFVFNGAEHGFCGAITCPIPAIITTTANWQVSSDQAGARLGYSVAGVGDVNGDHASDVLVGATMYDTSVPTGTNAGKVFAYYGVVEHTNPIAYSRADSIYEDTAVDGIIVITDTHFNPRKLTVELVDPPLHGTVYLRSRGGYHYEPALNYNGPDRFTYRAFTGYDYSAVATDTITVNPVNDAPVANNDTYTATEDLPRSVSAPGVLSNDSDPDGNPPTTAVLVSSVTYGALSLHADGSFVYTPTLNFFGTVTFTYRANDGLSLSDLATATLNVAAVNDPPIANGDSFTTTLNTPITIAVLINDSDIDGDSLTVTGVTNPDHGTAAIKTGTLVVYTPTMSYTGSDAFTYTISDGHGGTATAQVTLTITSSGNTPPVANNDTYTATEDLPCSVGAPGVLSNDSDVEGNPLTAALGSSVTHGALSLHIDGSFVYTPTLNFFGTDTFTYRASDGLSLSNLATVTLNVGAVNTAPTISDIPDQLAERGQTLGPIAFTVNDVDTPLGSLTLAAQSSNPTLLPVGSITLGGSGASRSLTLVPTAELTGTALVTITVSDGLLSNFDTFKLTVVAQLKRVYLPLIKK